MSESLSYQVEAYAMELCQTHSDLATVQMRHREDDGGAPVECVVFEFTEQEKAVRAIEGLIRGELMIEVRSPKAVIKDDLETVVVAISEVLKTAGDRTTDAQAAFADLIFDDGGTEEESATERLRKRVWRVPMFARLA
jgi:hypothetical protein